MHLQLSNFARLHKPIQVAIALLLYNALCVWPQCYSTMEWLENKNYDGKLCWLTRKNHKSCPRHKLDVICGGGVVAGL